MATEDLEVMEKPSATRRVSADWGRDERVRSVYSHIQRLADLGLKPIPRWGGGHALPGTNHRAFADNPPAPREVACADYSGGLAILTGTAHPLGGYVLGVDIDEGPTTLPGLPRGFLYAETGTASGKFHMFTRVADRLDGQVNLIAGSGQLVAEIKGYGHALRSWPSLPPDKPRGYTPLAWATHIEVDAPLLSAQQTAEGISDWLSRTLGCEVSIKSRERLRRLPQRSRKASHGNSIFDQVKTAVTVEALAERFTTFRPAGKARLKGLCPLHIERTPSFHINTDRDLWHCFGACQRGGDVITLAQCLMDKGLL
jgi:hypothetical protein